MDSFEEFDEQQDLEQVRLNPANIQIWPGNARRYELLHSINCSDLIESIAREGGNQVPVIVRRIPADAVQFELIAGTRRHFAVSYLREHNRPHILLLAQVMRLTDQEAFRISDVENSARKDVSAVERARNYAWALDGVYRGKQLLLAEAIGRSTSYVSKMLAIARIPDEVLRAFSSLADLEFKPAYKLAMALADEEQRPRILEEARQLADEQIAQRDLLPIAPKEVLRRLLDRKTVGAARAVRMWSKPSGQPYLTLKKQDEQGLHIIVHKDAGACIWQLKTAFEECLDMRHRSGDRS